MQKQNLNESQSGRSMVEMLGVLAIIDVLSVGGIQGYKYAMDRHHANEWINNYNAFVINERAARDQALQKWTESY